VIPQVLRQHKRYRRLDLPLRAAPGAWSAAGIAIQTLEDGRFRGVASELTLLELTVRPLQLGRQDVTDEYELLLSYFPNLDLAPVSKEVLLGAAALCARHRLRTPDSILLATAIRSEQRGQSQTTTGGKPLRDWELKSFCYAAR